MKGSSGKFVRGSLFEELLKVSSDKFVRASLFEELGQFLRANSVAFRSTSKFARGIFEGSSGELARESKGTSFGLSGGPSRDIACRRGPPDIG